MTKNTYGTGSLRAHERRPDAARRRSRACSRRWPGSSADGDGRLRPRGRRSSSPARPSSGCATGSASSPTPPRSGRWPASVPDTGGVVVVPAFTGLGQPVVGPVRPGHDRRHHPRRRPGPTWPGPSSRRWPSRPATWSTRWPRPVRQPVAELRVDGGASVMDLLLQLQADQLGVPGQPAPGPGDDRARRGLPGRPGRGRVGHRSTRSPPAGSSTSTFDPEVRPHRRRRRLRAVAPRRRTLPRLGPAGSDAVSTAMPTARRETQTRSAMAGGRRCGPASPAGGAPAAEGRPFAPDDERQPGLRRGRPTRRPSGPAVVAVGDRGGGCPPRRPPATPRGRRLAHLARAASAGSSRSTIAQSHSKSASVSGRGRRAAPPGRAPRTTLRRPWPGRSAPGRAGRGRAARTSSTSTPSTWLISATSRSTRSALGQGDDELVDGPAGAALEDLDADDVAAHGTDAARHLAERAGAVGQPDAHDVGLPRRER